MQEIIKTVTTDVEDVAEETTQDVTIEQAVKDNNKTISEIFRRNIMERIPFSQRVAEMPVKKN